MVQSLRAQLYATAGSPAKRSLLRSLGAQHLLNSRSPDFASDLAQIGGVDVVLNSLTSPGMVAGSVAGLRPGGRLLEISKRDIWSPARLAQDRPDVHYSLLAVDFLPPSAVHSALTRAAQAVSSGSFCPLPQVMHGLQNVQAALRQMTQAIHVGKVVVRCAPSQRPASSANGRWVVTGGLGSLGSLVSSWLTQHGAIDLALVGRSGKLSAGNKELSQLLRGTGYAASVSIIRSNLASQEEAGMLSTDKLSSGPVVAGMVHASGVLADATLQRQSLVGIRAVFAAKVSSIQRLQSATAMHPIAQQILFSSVAALLGSPGQANYSAANGALDGLAAQWGAQGRAGVSSIQWGGWAGTGMASADANTAARLARLGMPLITPSQGLAALAGILGSPSTTPVLAAVPFEWDKFLPHGNNSRQPTFTEFARQVPTELSVILQEARAVSTNSVGAASTSTSAQQAEAVAAAVQSTISNVLGAPVSSSAPLMAAGLDSLGMVELRNALQTQLGLKLPSTLVFDYPTANDIADYITAQLPTATAGSRQLLQSRSGEVMSSSTWREDQVSSLVTHTQTSDITPAIQEVVASILGTAPAADTPLMAAGLDSLGMVEVRNALQARLGIQLPSTLLFDYPSIEAIAAFIKQRLPSTTSMQQLSAQASSVVNPIQYQQQAESQTLVVTAMVTSAPQGALHSTLARDTVTQVPVSRWDTEMPPRGLFSGPAVRFGSYLHNPATFDASAFSTSDTEAVYMDPQQRLLLQSAAEALVSSQVLGGKHLLRVSGKAGSSVGICGCVIQRL